MKVEEDILKLFVKKSSLSFSEIEKAIKVRSNRLAYYLRQLVTDGMLVKSNERYQLDASIKHELPQLSRRLPTPMPVVLLLAQKKGKTVLIQRDRYPYKGLWSLPGGRLGLHESLHDAVKRIGKEKLQCDVKGDTVCSVLRERVIENNVVTHSFLLMLVKVHLEGNAKWFDEEQVNKLPLVPSDKLLLQRSKTSRYDEVILKVQDDQVSLM